MKTIAFLGCGTLAAIIAEGIKNDLSGHYSIIAVCDIREEAAKKLAAECGCQPFTDIEEMLKTGPDMVVEAAAGSVLKENAAAILKSGADLVPLSVGAFADPGFYGELSSLAEENGRTVHVPSGAIGGFDLMGAGMAAGCLSASVVTEKPPKALMNSPWFKGSPDDTEEREVFSGTALEAIEKFPKNVNVAVALGIATVGPDRARVSIRSVPGLPRNRHTITLDGNFGHAAVTIEAAPSSNPSSSSLAAYSVLALLKKLASPIKIG